MDFTLKLLFRRQIRPVFGQYDAILVHFQKLYLFPAASGAENEADGRVLAFLPLVAIQPFQVEFYLPLVFGLEFSQFQLNGHKTLEDSVVKQQVQVKVFPVNNHALLPFHKGETLSEFQNETLQFAQNSCFQIVFQIVVFQAEEIKEIGVFEGSGRHGRVRRNLGIGNSCALKSLPGNKLAQIADAKLPGGSLSRIEKPCLLRF